MVTSLGTTGSGEEVINLERVGFTNRGLISVSGQGNVYQFMRSQRGSNPLVYVRPQDLNEAEMLRQSGRDTQVVFVDRFGVSLGSTEDRLRFERLAAYEEEERTREQQEFEKRKPVVQERQSPSQQIYGTTLSPGFAEKARPALIQEYRNVQAERARLGVVGSNLQGSVRVPERVNAGGVIQPTPATSQASNAVEELERMNPVERAVSQTKKFFTQAIINLEPSKTFSELSNQLSILGSKDYLQSRRFPQTTKPTFQLLSLSAQSASELFTELETRPVTTLVTGAGIVAAATVAPILTFVGVTGLTLQNLFTNINQGVSPRTAITRELADLTVGGIALGAESKALRTTKNILARGIARGTARYIPAEQIFEPAVLRGEAGFPTTPSPSAALRDFLKAPRQDNTIQTISATTNRFAKQVEVKGTDPEVRGLYVTPAGRGSPYFLRQIDDATSRDLIPSQVFNFRRPTALIVDVTNVERIPSSVLKGDLPLRAGRRFVSSSEFLKQQAESRPGVAFISPRSEFRRTSEIEAIIPETSVILRKDFKQGGVVSLLSRFRGFEEFTVVRGEVVGVQRFSVRGSQEQKGLSTSEFNQRLDRSVAELQQIGRRERTTSVNLGYTSRERRDLSRDINRINRRETIREPLRDLSRRPVRREETPRIPVRVPQRTIRLPDRITRLITRPPTRPSLREPPVTRPPRRPPTDLPPSQPPTFKLPQTEKFMIKKQYTKKLKRLTQYNPSVVGVQFKIPKLKIPRTFTGFEIRGV